MNGRVRPKLAGFKLTLEFSLDIIILFAVEIVRGEGKAQKVNNCHRNLSLRYLFKPFIYGRTIWPDFFSEKYYFLQGGEEFFDILIHVPLTYGI